MEARCFTIAPGSYGDWIGTRMTTYSGCRDYYGVGVDVGVGGSTILTVAELSEPVTNWPLIVALVLELPEPTKSTRVRVVRLTA